MKKIVNVIIAGIVFVLLANFISASEKGLLAFHYQDENNSFVLTDLVIAENNPYYLTYFIENSTKTEFTISLFENNTLLAEEQANFPPVTLINYSDKMLNASKIVVYDNGTIVFEKIISFCNNNGICEPCFGGNCTSFENELTCKDCKQSSKDDYCNVLNDSICDPDCLGYVYTVPPENATCLEDSLLSPTCVYYGWSECGSNEICSEKNVSLQNGMSCCTGACKKDELYVNPCQNYFSGNYCNENETCNGKPVFIEQDNMTCCAYGTCDPVKIVDTYSNLTLQEKSPGSPGNFPLIYLVIGMIVVSCFLIFIFSKNRKVFLILFAVLVIAVILFFVSNRLSITGNATMQSFNSQLSRTTWYYTPYETDAAGWYNGEPTNKNGLYYCQIPDSRKTFFDTVRCEGSGIANFNGQDRMCHYDTIKTSKAASMPYCIYDPAHSRGTTASGANPTAKRTIACPPELRLGQQVYLDFGSGNYWTGCYVCEDRGGAITGNHFDVYAGVGLSSIKNPPPDYAHAYLGCGDTAPPDNSNGNNKEQPPANTDTQPPGTSQTIPAEITSGDKLGYYYLNPSFTLDLGYDLDIYSKLTQNATKLVNDCKAGPDSCILPRCWTKDCSVNFDTGLHECKIEVETFYDTYYYDETNKQYTEDKDMKIKFALQLENAPKDNPEKCLPPPICGNGLVEPGEQCDDGNRVNGDGCSDKCIIEPKPPTPPPGNPPTNPPSGVVYKPCGTTGNRLLGVDVYSGDGGQGTPIQWQTLKSHGFGFAFIKSSEGTSIDNAFKYNLDGAYANGILAGSYHFARPDKNSGVSGAQTEAEFYYNWIKPKLGEMKLLPALDFEPQNQEGIAKEWVDAFMAKFYELSNADGNPITPILYTNINYMGFIDPQGTKYTLWIANWPDSLSNWPNNINAVMSTSENPRISRNWDFWQFYVHGQGSGIGIPGNRGSVDVDVFNGDINCLSTRYVA